MRFLTEVNKTQVTVVQKIKNKPIKMPGSNKKSTNISSARKIEERVVRQQLFTNL